MKIVVIDNEPDIRELVSFAISSRFSFDPIEIETSQKLEDYLQKNSDVDLIISERGLIERLNLKIPHFFIDKPRIIEPLVKELQNRLPRQSCSNEFVPVKFDFLVKSKKMPVDIYAKLSEGRFIRVLKKGDEIVQNDDQKYHNKNIHSLHVRRSEIDTFLLKMAREIESQILLKSPLNFDLDLSANALRMIREISAQMGFTEEIQALAKASACLASQKIKNNKDWTPIFNELKLRDENDYIVDHCMVVSVVACGIADSLGWHSEAVANNLALAGFLHDVYVKDALLSDVDRLEDLVDERYIEKYAPSDVVEYAHHPELASELISLELPDVANIIRVHHEKPDGTGFPEGINFEKISPIAAVFIFAEDLVNFMIKSRFTNTVADFCSIRKSQYSKGFFPTILGAVSKK